MKFSLNGEDNTWLDPQSVRVCFTVKNKDENLKSKLRPLAPPYSFFRRMRIVAGSQVLEDFDNYDNEIKTLKKQVGSENLTYDVDAVAIPGFKIK